VKTAGRKVRRTRRQGADKNELHLLRVSVYRYLPERDEAPWMQDYELELEPSRGLMVLDVLERLKEEDPSLAFRRSCREGVCGSDGLNINGVNTLACVTKVADFLQGGHLPSGQVMQQARGQADLVIRPLPGMPVVRDLVVDMTLFWEQYRRIHPYLINDTPPPAIERLQSPEERAKLDGLYECILCACCSTACPSWWWNPDKYVGPAGLLNAYRFLADSRDTGATERLRELGDQYSVYRCKSIMNCAAFCPKKLNPRAAIRHIEELLLKHRR